MKLFFQNQTVLITGAGIGIGFAIAKALVQQGANVLLNDYDEELAKKAAETIREGGSGALRSLPRRCLERSIYRSYG